MGKIIVRKVKGMSLKVKISLVLVFTMLFSTFIYQGWYAPKNAMAAAAFVRSATGNTGANTAGSFNVTMAAAPVNGNTMIAVISTRGTTANRVDSITQTGATWQFVAEGTNANGVTTEIWYAPNVQSGGTGVAITLAASLRAAAVVAEYSGLLSANAVDNTAQNTGNGTNATTGTTATTTQAAELWIGGIGFINSTPTFGTIQNTFTQVGTAETTAFTTSNDVEMYFLEKIVAATGAATTGGTISTTAQWAGAIATFIAVRNTVAVATGTNPASVGVNPGDLNKTIDGFRMTASAGTPQVTAVQATVTNPANLSSIKLYLDGGTTVGSYDAGDTLLATVASPGTTVDFTGLTQTPATGGTNYIIVGDVAGSATAFQTVTAVVSDITVTSPDAKGTIADTSATLTINQVPVFNFSAANFNKTEGNSGTSTATITVTRSGLTTGAYTVNYATSDGTATVAAGDYLAASGMLSFASGETSKTFTVTVNGDVSYETDETVNLTLSSPSAGSYLGTPNATLTIVNNDPLPLVGFYLPTTVGVVQAGSASIPVRLSAASGSTVTVKYSTANGTAATPANYTGVTNATLTFNPDEVVKNIPITLTSGNNLTFTVTLSAPTNATLGTPLTNTVTMVTKYPSTIASCNGCHGTASAIADGAARNNPANTFLGSHNEHVITYGYTCSVCHVAPGGTSYNHRNGTINMAANINGDTGGAYGKGASWTQVNPPAAFLACSNTYCHSQGTSKTINTGETRTTIMSAPTASLNWGSAGSCDSCHGYPPSYTSGDTTWGAAKANSHVKHDAFKCYVCHHRTTDDGVTVASLARHVNRFYNISAIGGGTTATFSYTYAAAGGGCGTIYCHNLAGASQNATWGGTITLGCIDCHSKTIYRTNGRPGKTLAAVKNEFNLTWGHRNAARTTANGAVTGADCIVCHLEGNYTSQKPSDFHADGNIDLRDPRGSGETPITNLSGGTFTFQRFSTSFAAGTRTTSGHLDNTDIAQVISIKFCMACHRSGGATNTTARSNNGGTGTAAMPFGGINLGANYTVANGATATGGLVNVFSQFSSGNSSRHPVGFPNTRDFPTAARMVAPYNNQEAGRINAGGVRTQSVVMTCFDCHNTTGLLTTRTVAAHGNAASLRGTYYVSSPTLCTACHGGSATYATGSSTNHGAGSALASSSNQVSMSTCAACHASATSKPARPVPAQDYHGFNRLAGSGTDAWWPTGATETSRPYSFIRNTGNWTNHRPKDSPELASGTATCTVTGSCQGGTYTTGGTY